MVVRISEESLRALQALSREGEPPRLSASEEQSDCAPKPSAPAIGEKDDAVLGPGDVATSESHGEQPSQSVALDGLPMTTAEVTGEEHWETDAVVAAGIALPSSNRGSVATSAPGELAGEGGSSPEPSHPESERGLHHKQLEKAEEHVTATDSLTGVLPTNASAPEGSSGEQLRGTGCSALADNLASDDQMGGSPSPMAAEGASQLRQQEAGLGPLSDGVHRGEAASLASRNVAELEQASLEEVEDLECLKGMEVDHQKAERVVMPNEASDSGMMTSVEDLVVLKVADALTPPGAVALPAAVISSRRSCEPELSDPDAELAEEPMPACHHPPSTIEDVANENGEVLGDDSSPTKGFCKLNARRIFQARDWLLLLFLKRAHMVRQIETPLLFLTSSLLSLLHLLWNVVMRVRTLQVNHRMPRPLHVK